MTSITTLEKLTKGRRDAFEDEGLAANPELDARIVSGWDSLGDVRRSV